MSKSAIIKGFIALFSMMIISEKSAKLKKIVKNKFSVPLIFAILISFSISILAYYNVFNRWQMSFSDLLYSGKNPSAQITIVNLDNQSLDEKYGFGTFQSWDRSIYAQVLQNINKYQPKIVAFDINFRSVKSEEGDTALQKALVNTKNPVLIYPMNADKYKEDGGYYVQETAKTAEPLKAYTSLPNVTLATSTALIDTDSSLRRLMPFVMDQLTKKYHENLAFAVARIALGNTKMPEQPRIHPGSYVMDMSVQNSKIPLEQGQMLINYSTNPGEANFKNISFFDVYHENYVAAGQNPTELFKDKIVFIGPKAAYFNDRYFTPINKVSRMDGVEIQANALQTILEQNFLRNISLTEKILLILAFCFSATFIFFKTKIRWSLFFLFAVPSIYTLIAKPSFMGGVILDLVHPYLAIIVTFMAIYIYRYFTEFREKIQLKNAFSKYVNPDVVNQIMQEPEKLKLGGEKKPITVLFTDIAHFTSISEQLKPESLVALLNEYFEAMSEVILSQNGTLDKFEGDAIMAFFGAPLDQQDHTFRACLTALLMRKKLQKLIQKWQNDPPLPGGENKPIIDFRCGISAGEVIVGNIGSNQRFDYTVMGDVVNLGSRLEGVNKKYNTNIILSEEAAQKVQDKFELRELDLIRVVGKKQPIKIFELLNIKGGLNEQASHLLQQYNEGIKLYHARKFVEALEQFNEILKTYPADGPSNLYKQRCEVLKDFPPAQNWDGIFEMGTK